MDSLWDLKHRQNSHNTMDNLNHNFPKVRHKSLKYNIKNMWKVVSKNFVWSHVIKEKYMFGQTFSSWISSGAKNKFVISHIWRSVMHTLHWMLGFVYCGARYGSKIKIGLDAIMGIDGNHSLSFQLQQIFHIKKIRCLQQIYLSGTQNIDQQSWRRVEDLDIQETYHEEWGLYVVQI